MNIPIIYIHYGDSTYLSTSLYYAKKYNPLKQIILLGDDDNKKYAINGIKFYYYNEFDSEDLLTQLSLKYKYIRGGVLYEQVPKVFLKRSQFELFCFKRWMYLYYFLQEANINNCWYFDSDTIILSDLNLQEYKYREYDCTEQSNGSCMKGFLSKASLFGFSNEIIRLFDDKKYLEQVRRAVSENPDWAFCDMRAYIEYKNRNNLFTIPLYEVNNYEAFDDALLQERNCEMVYDFRINRHIKKLYYSNHNVYIKDLISKNLIKLNCINFSWLPNFYVKMVLYRIENNSSIPIYKIFFQLIYHKIYLFLRENIKFRFRNLRKL